MGILAYTNTPPIAAQTVRTALFCYSSQKNPLIFLGFMSECLVQKNHFIDMDSWYSIGTSESDIYEMAKCCHMLDFFKL